LTFISTNQWEDISAVAAEAEEAMSNDREVECSR
jgi:hypothetical protein